LISLSSQPEKIKHVIDLLIESGVRNKTQLYSRLVTKTGLPRPTIRRISAEYKKQLMRKVMVLSDSKNMKKFKVEEYSFIPETIRFFWQKKTKQDLVSVRCQICKKQICYLEGMCEGSLVCNECQPKFPKEKKKHGK